MIENESAFGSILTESTIGLRENAYLSVVECLDFEQRIGPAVDVLGLGLSDHESLPAQPLHPLQLLQGGRPVTPGVRVHLHGVHPENRW